jgi:hypothetical protein
MYVSVTRFLSRCCVDNTTQRKIHSVDLFFTFWIVVDFNALTRRTLDSSFLVEFQCPQQL